MKNNLNDSIEVKITSNNGGNPKFFEVKPGQTEKWTRTNLETIFVKYASSYVLRTYLGIPGQNLYIDRERQVPHDYTNHWFRAEIFVSWSGAPVYRYEKNRLSNNLNVIASIFHFVTNKPSNKLDVFDEESKAINVKVSNVTNPKDSEGFVEIRPGQSAFPNPWCRSGPEVIYVNGPYGTAVGTYYGKPEYTVDADSPM